MATTQASRSRCIEGIEMAVNDIVQDLIGGSSLLRLGLGFSASFPGASPEEARKFAAVLRVLELIHAALTQNVVLTKRDLYYRDPELFGNQGFVDRIVDGIAGNMKVSRNSLNVTAAAKGLVAGPFTISRQDGETIRGTMVPQLVPHLRASDIIEMPEAKWILVIEKEATFASLVSILATSADYCLPGIMLTGKGYPDLATRTFLRRLSISHARSSPAPLIAALVDYDPDGLSILSTYKHGSEAFAREAASLTVPRLRWLGLKNVEIVGASSDVTSPNSQATGERGLLHMSARDRAKALSMLNSKVCNVDGHEPEWRRELQVMLMLNLKAEIQLLEDRPGGLRSWLAGKLDGQGGVMTGD